MIVLLCALAFSAQGQIGVPLSYPATLNDYAAGDSAQDRDVDIAVDGQGRWVVVWESNTTLGSTGNDYDIFTAWSDDHGQTWSVPLPLNTFADRDGLATDRDPRLTVDADGAFIVTWMSHCRPDGTIDNDFDILMSVSVNRGQTWAPATSVNINAVADEGNDFDPVIGVGGEVWVAAWRTLDSLVSTIGPDAEIVFSRREAGQSEWSSPLPLNSDAANDVSQDAFPQLVYHDGAWMCVWHASLYFGSDYDIVISRSVDQAKSWSPVTPLYANAVSDGNAHDDNPQVCVNGRGDMIVIWSSTNSLGGTIGSDRDLLVSRSSDGGASWSAPAALHSTFASDNGDDNFPRIACDSDGTFIVVWQSESSLGGSGSDSDIFISKSSDGGVTWSTPIAANLNATADSGDDLMPRVAAYGGAWLIAWQSHDTMGGTLGPDADLLRARFALPDCNSNTVADQTEPDVNGNNIPDDCEGSTCTGDIAPPLGGNGSVNVDDLLAVINAWGACSGACLSDIAPPSGDGQVNVDDLLAIINNWGPCD
jgi:hypothetical protein